MAVYKRTYVPYEGPRTPAWSRFLILPRVSYERLWQSRFLIMFFMACFFYPIGLAAYIYIANNLSILQQFQRAASQYITIDASVFLFYCSFQGGAAYLLTAFVGPSLVSPDLVNGALPLYLGRPFSRVEYLLGKLSVLVFLLSTITWIPGLILFGIQGSLAGWTWTKDNLFIAGALVAGMLLWIIVLSLIALAVSALVKWKVAAGAVLMGVFFAGAGFGSAVNQVLRTQNGYLLNIRQVIYTVWAGLFGTDPDNGLSLQNAWMVLGVVVAACILLLLRRVRAFEVVK